MYKMYDKAAAIREIQRYLGKISTTEGYISPSGVYDLKTRDAVLRFQKNNGLRESGIVDLESFNALYNSYQNELEISKMIENIGQNQKPPYLLGDYGDFILSLNKMLADLLSFYGVHHSIRESSYYSKATEDGHLSLRRIFGLSEGAVDHEFINRLTKETRFLKKDENF